MGQPEFNNFTHFVEASPNDPSKFPKDSSTLAIAHGDSNEVLLSLSFRKKIESR